MSYSLEAVIGTDAAVRAAARPWPLARVASLGSGLALLPLTEEFVAGLAPKYGSAADEPIASFPEFRFAVPRWLRDASHGATLAFVGAEYFGGIGAQWSIAMKDGAVALGPLKGTDSINRALQLLGVKCDPGKDEFDTVGLGRHRSVEKWAASWDSASDPCRGLDVRFPEPTDSKGVADFRYLLALIGQKARQSIWFASNVECTNRSNMSGPHPLEILADRGVPVSSDTLFGAADVAGQLIDGYFSARTNPEGDTWLVIRALEGDGFFVMTEDEDVLKSVRKGAATVKEFRR